MPDQNKTNVNNFIFQIALAILDWPWMVAVAEGWKLARKLWRGLGDEGMYEVLEYETKLELLDKQGKKSSFIKTTES